MKNFTEQMKTDPDVLREIDAAVEESFRTPKKQVVVNFSHPLSDLAVEQITAEIGNFRELQVRVQVDMEAPLLPQIKKK